MAKQYKHILVPLDGSELAELAVADAFGLAQSSLAEVTLLQVVHPAERVLGVDTPHPVYLAFPLESRSGTCDRHLTFLLQKKERTDAQNQRQSHYDRFADRRLGTRCRRVTLLVQHVSEASC